MAEKINVLSFSENSETSNVSGDTEKYFPQLNQP